MESCAAFASLLSNRLKLMFVPNFFYSNLKAKLWTLFNEQSSVNFEQLIWYGIKLMLFTCISEYYYNLASLNTITVMLMSWWWWQFLDRGSIIVSSRSPISPTIHQDISSHRYLSPTSMLLLISLGFFWQSYCYITELSPVNLWNFESIVFP